MYIYTFIQLYIYTFIHLYIYTFIHLYIYTFIHLYIYSFIHLYIYTFIHLYIYTFIHFTHLYIYTFIHLYIYAFIHLYIYTFTSEHDDGGPANDRISTVHPKRYVACFFDGYCSTVQGLLDCFEVDLGFTELSFTSQEVCSLSDSNEFMYVCMRYSLYCKQ